MFQCFKVSRLKSNSGTLELWNFGTLELWNSGTLELWNFGTLELNEVHSRLSLTCAECLGLLFQCSKVSMFQCFNVKIQLWNSGTLELWNSGTLELWNNYIKSKIENRISLICDSSHTRYDLYDGLVTQLLSIKIRTAITGCDCLFRIQYHRRQ